MRKRLLDCLAALAVGGSTALAQGPAGPGLPPAPVPAAPAAAADGAPAGPVVPLADDDRLWLSSHPSPVPAEDPSPLAGRLWFSTDYLLWWFKRSPLPVPLVTTTSDLTSQPPAALLQPATSTVLGDQNLGTGAHSGGRFGAGLWIDGRGTIGIEGNYFFLANRTVIQAVSSTGDVNSQVLAVPFFDADAGAESSFLLAFPGAQAGAASVVLTNRLQGAELNGVVAALAGPNLRFEVLAGFRFLDFHENLTFTTTSTGIEPPDGGNNGLILNTTDQFDADNRFYGWQVGARGEYLLGNLVLGAWAKFALGDMSQTMIINGFTETNFFNAPPGGPFTGVPTGIISGQGTFAQPSNVGRANRHELVVVPEVGARVGYQFASWARAFVGYQFLYVSNVVRPGDQIDRNINVSQTVQNAVAGNPSAPGSLPAVNLTGSSFWAQGLSLGVEFRF